jgi:hypothetical protein
MAAGRAGRGPGTVFTISAAVVFLVLAALAFSPANKTPPALAELAPAPHSQITQAPSEQSSKFGSGAGGGAGGDGASRPTPTPSAQASVPSLPPQARLRRCVGNPPRQTEDPQSPPCVYGWNGKNNGGATSKGVTADTITVAVPWIAEGPGQGQSTMTREVMALQKFFNDRFEFYGRKLSLQKTDPGNTENDGTPNPSAQSAAAVSVDEQTKAFASLPYPDEGGADYYYYDELARRHIVSIYSALGTSESEAKLQKNHPYEWGILPPADVISDNQGEWMCKNVNGGNAIWSGQYTSTPRKYAIIVSDGPDGTAPPISKLLNRLAGCGIKISETVHVDYANANQDSRTAVVRLAQDGITTVIPWTSAAVLFLNLYQAADEAKYTPEWVITSNLNEDEDTAGLLGQPSQTVHSFGLRFQNKAQLVPNVPANWAIHEADPGAANISLANEKYIYQPLMVLASGIEWAGPNLTPQTFGAALLKLKFPNPNAGASPWWQAHVGFGPGDHTWFDDATPVFWNQNVTSREVAQPTGAYCYIHSGTRYRLGQWPADSADMFKTSRPCY